MTTTSGADLAGRLGAEFRRRRIVIPGVSALERMSGQAMLAAERRVEAIRKATASDTLSVSPLDEVCDGSAQEIGEQKRIEEFAFTHEDLAHDATCPT